MGWFFAFFPRLNQVEGPQMHEEGVVGGLKPVE